MFATVCAVWVCREGGVLECSSSSNSTLPLLGDTSLNGDEMGQED